MNFAWSAQSVANFEQSSQRTRYMASDYLNNRPSHAVPISAFQVAAHKTYPLYKTEHDSYVIIVTSTYIYLLQNQQLEEIVQLWNPKKRNPSGADRSHQLETFPGLWKDDPSYKLWDAFTPYRHTSLEDLYNAVEQTCRPSNFTSGELFAILPRPLHSQPRIPFGTGASLDHAGQLSLVLAVDGRVKGHRRGERKTNARRRGQSTESDQPVNSVD